MYTSGELLSLASGHLIIIYQLGSTKQGNYLAVTAILNRDISVDILVEFVPWAYRTFQIKSC